MDTMKILIRKIPVKLYRSLKSIAAIQGKTLTALIIEILEGWERDYRKK